MVSVLNDFVCVLPDSVCSHNICHILCTCIYLYEYSYGHVGCSEMKNSSHIGRRAGTIEKLGGQRARRRRVSTLARENRGAKGAEGSGVWGGGVPLPTGGGVWGGDCAPSPENFFDFGAQNSYFWCILGAIFLQFSCRFYTQKKVLLGLENLLLHALQVRREQKAEHAFWELYKAFANIEFRSFI